MDGSWGDVIEEDIVEEDAERKMEGKLNQTWKEEVMKESENNELDLPKGDDERVQLVGSEDLVESQESDNSFARTARGVHYNAGGGSIRREEEPQA
ncbi:hypothetical protein E2562_018080 [Oryza meyeriana var. granulata]|uniref:Uncharacterized protein n=1 Tax=Oryza meyeriana var. granulata TaxID=110450 RepID=A0A6G1CR27_9ORYZ|nr:hypothetical protein E2562_018080 [Oryza meyeriana var. granulata]